MEGVIKMGYRGRQGSNGGNYAAAAPTVEVWTEGGAAAQKRFAVDEMSGTLFGSGRSVVAQVKINGDTYNGSSRYEWKALRQALRSAAEGHPDIERRYGSMGTLARSISGQFSRYSSDEAPATSSSPAPNSAVMPPPASSLEGRIREPDDSWRLGFTPEEPGYGHGV